HGHEVTAAAHEALVLPDPNERVEVARRAAALARVALAGQSDPLLVGDPGGHVHGQPAAHGLAPAPPALAARRLRDAAIATTAIAHGLPHELSEGGAGDRPQLARPPAARAGLDRRARLGAVAVAVLADAHGVVVHIHRCPGRRL